MTKNNICCCIYSILASLLGAAGIASVFYTGIVSSILVLVYITLILGILALIGVLCKGRKKCECIDECFIASTVGSIITSIFALTVTALSTFSIPVAILIGAVAFFLISNIINIIKYLICVLCNRYCK